MSSKNQKLTNLQKRFADNILTMELIGKVNNRQAYEDAGYSCRGETARKEAEKTLRKPHVKRYLARVRAKRAKRIEKSNDDIIAEFEKLAFSELTDFYTFDKNGIKITPSKGLSKANRAQIKAIYIKEHHYTNKKGKKGKTVDIKIELHGKQPALISLAKIRGLMKDQKVDEAITTLAQAIHDANESKE